MKPTYFLKVLLIASFFGTTLQPAAVESLATSPNAPDLSDLKKSADTKKPAASAVEEKKAAAAQGVKTLGEILANITAGFKQAFLELNYLSSKMSFPLSLPLLDMARAAKLSPSMVSTIEGFGVKNDTKLMFEWNLGSSGSGFEPELVSDARSRAAVAESGTANFKQLTAQEIMNLSEEQRELYRGRLVGKLLKESGEFVSKDLDDGFDIVFMTTTPAAMKKAMEFMASLEPFKDNWGLLFGNIARLRGDTVFFFKLLMLSKLAMTNQYAGLFPDLKSKVSFVTFEMLMLMARLSKTTDPELSIVDIAKTREKFPELAYDGSPDATLIKVLNQNLTKQPEVLKAVVFAKRIRYKDPFGFIERLFKTFYLGDLIDPSKPNSLKVAASARDYLAYMSSVLYKSKEAQLAVSIAWDAKGGFEGRAAAFEAQVLPLMADAEKVAAMSLFDREYLVYALYSLYYSLPASVKTISDEATRKKALVKRATLVKELVTKFNEAFDKLPAYALPAAAKITDKTMAAGVAKCVDAVVKDLNDRIDLMLKTLDTVIQSESADALVSQQQMIPDASYEASGQVQVPLMSWLKMQYSTLGSVMTRDFQGDEGYVRDPLPVGYKKAFLHAVSIGLRVMADLPKASKLYAATDEYKAYRDTTLKAANDELKAAAAEYNAAGARLKTAPTDAALKKTLAEAKTKVDKAKFALIKAQGGLKAKAMNFKFERIKGGTPESLTDFMIRELVLLFMKTPNKDEIIGALNRFTKPLGVDLTDPQTMAMITGQAASQEEADAEALMEGVDLSLFEDDGSDDETIADDEAEEWVEEEEEVGEFEELAF